METDMRDKPIRSDDATFVAGLKSRIASARLSAAWAMTLRRLFWFGDKNWH